MADIIKKQGNQEEELDKVESTFNSVGNALNKGEAFLENNQKPIYIGIGIVTLLVVSVMLFKNFYIEPRDKEAKESIYGAEQMFVRDSFQSALDGKDDVMGFLEIIEEYGSTKSGNLAKAYAGLCYKQLGDYETAIEYLEKFDADDKMIQPSILGAIGDCYWDLEKAEKAIVYYKKAASADNDIVTPFYNKRAAIAYLSLGENDKAVALLENIVKKYPQFSDMSDVQKYLEYAKSK
jgi:tetratricopeptide (TPR) repeat protein